VRETKGIRCQNDRKTTGKRSGEGTRSPIRLASRRFAPGQKKDDREPEGDGLVIRKVYPQVPLKVEYSLTETGQSLIPIPDQLGERGSNPAAAVYCRGISSPNSIV
jgi:hypothetical protein